MLTTEERFAKAWAARWENLRALGIPTARTEQAAQTQGALEAARRCLSGRRCSDGFQALARLGRLELSLEALALEPTWGSLFTDEQANEAIGRLLEAGYDFRPEARNH